MGDRFGGGSDSVRSGVIDRASATVPGGGDAGPAGGQAGPLPVPPAGATPDGAGGYRVDRDGDGRVDAGWYDTDGDGAIDTIEYWTPDVYPDHW
jgi:hypothetical protein